MHPAALREEEGPGCLWGSTRGRWVCDEETSELLGQALLLRGLCGEQAKALQLVVRENHLLASFAGFQAP
jgi:hypothetical protein